MKTLRAVLLLASSLSTAAWADELPPPVVRGVAGERVVLRMPPAVPVTSRESAVVFVPAPEPVGRWTTPPGGGAAAAASATEAPPPPKGAVVVEGGPADVGAGIDRVAKWLKDNGFSLRRSVAPEAGEDRKPATFSYLRDMVGDEDVTTANFALKWTTAREDERVLLAPFGFVEGHLTSAKKKRDDAWLFGVGGEGALYTGSTENETSPLGFSGLSWDIKAKYETDQRFEIGKLAIEANVIPTLAALGIGQALPKPVLDGEGHRIPTSFPFRFVWEPTLGTTVGYTNADGDSAEHEDLIFRLHARVLGMILLDPLTEFLHGFDPKTLSEKHAVGDLTAYLFADWTYFYMPNEDDTTHDYGLFGLHVPLTKHVGFDVTYITGENKPKFRYTESIEVALAVIF